MAKAKKVTTKVIKVEAPKATTSGTPITANEVIQNWDKNKEKYCQSAGLDKSISNEDAFIICVQKARYGILK